MERTVFTGGAVFDASGTDPAPGEVVVDGDRIVEVRSGWREDHGTGAGGEHRRAHDHARA